MSNLVAKKAPTFHATAVLPDGSFQEDYSLDSFQGRYVVLFFYPLDFTFVCPSEILAFDEALEDFKSRDCEVIGVSVDSEYTHLAWRKTPVDQGGIGPIGFPLISDLDKQIARKFDVLLDETVALRGLFLIDREGVIRHAVINDLPLGRSVQETLRMLDALRFHEQKGEVCPADWSEGDEGMEPTSEGVVDYLSKFSKTKD